MACWEKQVNLAISVNRSERGRGVHFTEERLADLLVTVKKVNPRIVSARRICYVIVLVGAIAYLLANSNSGLLVDRDRALCGPYAAEQITNRRDSSTHKCLDPVGVTHSFSSSSERRPPNW
jgi:hypothetical protein